jgi:hypothetical protein
MGGFQSNCPHCAQALDIPEETAGMTLSCPNCHRPIPVPVVGGAVGSGTSSGTGGRDPVCAICLSPIVAGAAKNACPACQAEYHAECWQENGGCAIYGCSQVPVIEKRQALEIPISYWGQENKLCPSCKREILAAAVRCRHCGATFESARPQDAAEFQQRAELTQRLPALRRTVVCLFIVSVLPCLAPIGAVWGSLWYPAHRDDLRALPTLYGALCKIGWVVAIGQTVVMVLVTLLYALVRR